MRRVDRISVISLAASVLLHGALLCVCSRVAARGPSLTKVAANESIPQREPLKTRLLVDEPTTAKPRRPEPLITIKPTPEPPPLPPEPMPTPLEAIKPKPILPLELMPKETPPAIRPADGFGELTGTADANALHSLSGDRPMQAAKAEHDQPYISRDPAGRSRPAQTPAKVAAGSREQAGPVAQPGELVSPAPTFAANKPEPPKPAQVSAPKDRQGDQSSKPPAGEPPAISSQIAAIPPDTRFGPMVAERERAAVSAPPGKIEPAPLLVMAQPQPPANPPPPAPAAAALPPSTPEGSPDAGVSASSSADPAPMTDSESDPFSIVGSAEFRAGRVDAKFGRKVKTVKPRLTISGSYDLITAAPRVVLRVRADETGKVREVKIVRSSGSRDIDHPCQLAMYDWWFEPPRDRNGKPQPAEMLWTITFRSL